MHNVYGLFKYTFLNIKKHELPNQCTPIYTIVLVKTIPSERGRLYQFILSKNMADLILEPNFYIKQFELLIFSNFCKKIKNVLKIMRLSIDVYSRFSRLIDQKKKNLN